MAPYYVMVAVPAILSLLFSGRTDKFSEHKKNKTVIWFFFGIVLFMLSLRGEKVGSDTPVYLYHFEKISRFSIEQIFEQYENEYGYYLLNKAISFFTKNNQIFLAIIAIICVAPVAHLYAKNSENAMLTIAIFIISSNFPILFSGLRQSIALAVVAISYKYIKEKKLWKFLLLILLAFFFHKSALVALLLYPMYHMKITKPKLFVFIPIIATVFVFNKPIFEFMIQFLGEYGENYSAKETGAYAMIVLFALFVLLAYIAPDESKMDKETIGLRNIMVLALTMQTFALASPVAMRMNYYNIMLVPLLLPKIINRCHDRNRKTYQFIELGLIVFFILYYFYRAYTSDPATTLMLYPYKGFWE